MNLLHVISKLQNIVQSNDETFAMIFLSFFSSPENFYKHYTITYQSINSLSRQLKDRLYNKYLVEEDKKIYLKHREEIEKSIDIYIESFNEQIIDPLNLLYCSINRFQYLC